MIAKLKIEMTSNEKDFQEKLKDLDEKINVAITSQARMDLDMKKEQALSEKLKKELEVGKAAQAAGGNDPYRHITNAVVKKNLIKQDIQIAAIKKQIAEKKEK